MTTIATRHQSLRNLLISVLDEASCCRDMKAVERAYYYFCFQNFRIAIDPLNIDRVHRLGAFQQKYRNIVVRLSRFKGGDVVLSSCIKLTGTGFSVHKYRSRLVSMVRKRLLEFGKQQVGKYKLCEDKLIIGERVYVYDVLADRIVQFKSSNPGKASSSYCWLCGFLC